MKNPPCICGEVFAAACMGEMDQATWELEKHHWVMYGHCASCHHRSPEPKGILYFGGQSAKLLDFAVGSPIWRTPKPSDDDVANAALKKLFPNGFKPL